MIEARNESHVNCWISNETAVLRLGDKTVFAQFLYKVSMVKQRQI